ncbi:TRAP transporter substrate-binding protein [Halomonas dongshanensis]|uniref:TRAP transporter substrate-binding protein n=1 Tax=Halomonas dongshanensis TaxID=2890835 RepID=A0ABT2EF10_9GAMM|nr:TRAP transporter substrate-binding protein [Halomonas dongshanensis]MCS2609948.1 TRAP transporter substrate-binding protein [Halomonas dongshanensis]
MLVKLVRNSHLALVATTFALCVGQATAQEVTLRYGHMHTPNSIAGMQAEWLAEAIEEKTNGAVAVEIYPNSQLGRLQELAEAVSTGSVALSHNTAGAIGSLYAPFAAFDTPYLYRDVDHLMAVMDVDSPVMAPLNEELAAASGVRLLYAFYFGTRHLTANQAIHSPDDLSGVKIRSIPFPIYMATVEGMGAIPVPVDWSEVPTALATGVVEGQENPVNVVVSAKLSDVQSHLMLTGHISAAQVIVINDDTWQSLSPENQAAIAEAALEVRQRATDAMLEAEASDLAQLAEAGMQIVGPEEGLDVEAFRTRVQARIQEEFDDQYGELYQLIAETD